MNCPDIVVYHNPCVDGNCAAWSVSYLCAKFLSHTAISYIPTKAGEDVPNLQDMVAGKIVWFVDYCPSPQQLIILQSVAKYILLIDHHEKTINNMITYKYGNNVELYLDIKGCGASLVWKYFGKLLSIEIFIPEFIKYVEARDTWNYSLINSEIISTGLYSDPNINNWDYLTKLADENSHEYIDMCYQNGLNEKKYKDRCIEEAINYNKIACMYENYKIWLYTCNFIITSDVGNKLMDIPFADGSYPDFTLRYEFDIVGNKFKFSARSKDDKANVNIIANKFGGGGHRNASGFAISNCSALPLNTIFIPIS